MAWFVLVRFTSLFEKKRRGKYWRVKISRGKDLAGKKPSGEKTYRGKERRGKDLAPKPIHVCKFQQSSISKYTQLTSEKYFK